MFERYFGFTAMPFRKDLEPGQLYISRPYQEIMTGMRYRIGKPQLALITGDAGAGKTTAVRALCQSLDPERTRLLYLATPGLESHELYRSLLLKMGLKPSRLLGDSRRMLRGALEREWMDQGTVPVLIIDEAHSLEPDTLEELRALTNYDMDAHSLVTMILVGQPELRRTLQLRSFRALNQRIWLRFDVTGMTWDETRGYIQHHLAVAGVERSLFTEGATRLIFHQSHGLPGKVNQLALRGLEASFRSGQNVVDEVLVERASCL